MVTNTSNNSAQLPNQTTTTEGADEGFLRISLINQGVVIRKKKSCPLRSIPASEINYKNLKLLNKFLSERGKIIPSRITNVAAKKQRMLSNAIHRARHLALISPISQLGS